MTSLPLTPMQAKVADCLGRGLSYRQAGDELGIASGTVKAHVNAAAIRLPNDALLTPKALVALHGAHRIWEQQQLKKAG